MWIPILSGSSRRTSPSLKILNRGWSFCWHGTGPSKLMEFTMTSIRTGMTHTRMCMYTQTLTHTTMPVYTPVRTHSHPQTHRKMCPAWREMNAVCYPRRIEIINACRQGRSPLAADTLDNMKRTIDDKSADRLAANLTYSGESRFALVSSSKIKMLPIPGALQPTSTNSSPFSTTSTSMKRRHFTGPASKWCTSTPPPLVISRSTRAWLPGGPLQTAIRV